MIIGFAGLIASGKSSIAAYLQNIQGGTCIQFADPLYKLCNIFDSEIYQGMSQESKLQPFAIKPEWTRREALQKLGTELIREQVSYSAWTDLFKAAATEGEELYKYVYCADVRFPNEVETIKELGGLVLWISRPQSEQATQHISGNAITAADCFKVIDNSHRLNDTALKVQIAVRKFKSETKTKWV